MMAPQAEVQGAVKDGNLRMTFHEGVAFASNPGDFTKTTFMRYKRADIDILRVFRERILGKANYEEDYRSFRPAQLYQYVQDLKERMPDSAKLYWRANYLFHSRMANAFIILTFALLGAILGIFDERRGKNWGYIGSILKIG